MVLLRRANVVLTTAYEFVVRQRVYQASYQLKHTRMLLFTLTGDGNDIPRKNSGVIFASVSLSLHIGVPPNQEKKCVLLLFSVRVRSSHFCCCFTLFFSYLVTPPLSLIVFGVALTLQRVEEKTCYTLVQFFFSLLAETDHTLSCASSFPSISTEIVNSPHRSSRKCTATHTHTHTHRKEHTPPSFTVGVR